MRMRWWPCWWRARRNRYVAIFGLSFVLLVAGKLLDNTNRRDLSERGREDERSSVPDQHDRRLKMVTTPTAHHPQVSTDGHDQPIEELTTAERIKTTSAAVTTATASTTSSSTLQVQQRYAKRNERVNQVCRKYAIVSSPPKFVVYANASQPTNRSASDDDTFTETPNTSHFSLAPSFNAMGCFLNKVASSSLVTAFLLTRGYGPTFSSPHSMAFALQPKTLAEFHHANTSYFKFMFVRHPMDRMLSCYRDKMVVSVHEKLPPFRTFVKKTGQKIIRQRMLSRLQTQRQQPADPNLPQHVRTRRLIPTVSERVEQLVDKAVDSRVVYGRWKSTGSAGNAVKTTSHAELNRTNQQRPRLAPKQGDDKEVIPSFEEFLEYVLSTDLQGVGFDSHWVPFHRYCTPCSMDYDVIGKLETGAEDFQYVWKQTGLASKAPVPWLHRVTSSAKAKSKLDMEMRYYSSLPRELIIRFYRVFQLDFELFQYDINEVLLKGGHAPLTDEERF